MFFSGTETVIFLRDFSDFFLLAWGKASLISTKSSGHPKDFFQDFEVGNVAEKDICPPEIEGYLTVRYPKYISKHSQTN